jgi:hypothetical protein
VGYYSATNDQFLKDYVAGQDTGKRLLEAASVGGGLIDITNQTSSGESVLLMGMRVLVLKRKPPPTTGIVVDLGAGCGSGVQIRPFSNDLNIPNSPIIARAIQNGSSAATFPFKISPNDPEVFEIAVRDTTCDCRIAIEIDWVAAGKRGKTILDNGGEGFWIVAAPTVPTYTLGDDCRYYNRGCQLIPARYLQVVRTPPS